LADFRILARMEKKREGPFENPYKEWIFVKKIIAIF
jgi:hypothetical protein